MDSTKKGRRVALFVGVDTYTDKSIPPLVGAVEDARALHKFFSERKNQFDTAEILENPTSDEVLDKVESLSADLDKGDLFLFYFAGHGMDDDGKQKLLCKNTRHAKRALANDFDLRNVAGREKWNVAVILDACRTRLDAARGGEDRVGERRDLDFYDALVTSRGTGDASLSVLFSCDEGKTAGEVKGKNHGLFTLALLDVLERADNEHRGWCFDQNLGDEIGRTMQRLADSDSGQRPWIKASGTPPLFFLPSMDMEPLLALAEDLRKGGWLSVDESGKCQQAIGGNSPGPCAKGIFETVRFFSNWQEERGRKEVPRELAAALIRAFCDSVRTANEPAQAVPDEPPVEPVDDADGPGPQSRRLSKGTLRRLSNAADGVTDGWKTDCRKMREACEAMKAASCESDAIDAIREAEEALRDTFIKENPLTDFAPQTLCRLDPLFSSKAWNALRRDLPDESQCPDEVDKALSGLFRFANTCCRILRN